MFYLQIISDACSYNIVINLYLLSYMQFYRYAVANG